jgi:TRAP-type C4-dicarboxylate transport system permease small subunit
MFTNTMSGIIDSTFSMIMCISCILFFLYIIYDISLISKSQMYIGMKENAVQMNYALMFGFILLVDFIGLI